jgi:hypothetical protein
MELLKTFDLCGSPLRYLECAEAYHTAWHGKDEPHVIMGQKATTATLIKALCAVDPRLTAIGNIRFHAALIVESDDVPPGELHFLVPGHLEYTTKIINIGL